MHTRTGVPTICSHLSIYNLPVNFRFFARAGASHALEPRMLTRADVPRRGDCSPVPIFRTRWSLACSPVPIFRTRTSADCQNARSQGGGTARRLTPEEPRMPTLADFSHADQRRLSERPVPRRGDCAATDYRRASHAHPCRLFACGSAPIVRTPGPKEGGLRSN
jgi:hypothetical protein